tara:strand:+ start:635 stop:1330 length:696 start_codon:yes stop_codon:yes gene_type:complete
MNFKERLLQGKLIKRYKRFFVDIKYKNEIITAHCPNSGSMMGLLGSNNKVWFSKSNNPDRKLKYTLEIIKVKNSLVGINTLITNKLVLEALNKKKIKELIKYDEIITEKKFSKKTRFDFFLSNKKGKCFLEVKNVTLNKDKNIAEFPDAVTKRGTKHLHELSKAKKKGFESYILYLIQREDCKSFRIAEEIDKEYKSAFINALKNGVKVLCYDCKINSEGIKVNNQIYYEK